MRTPIASPWPQLKAALPPLAAFLFLVGLAVWGHVTHWKLGLGDTSWTAVAGSGSTATRLAAVEQPLPALAAGPVAQGSVAEPHQVTAETMQATRIQFPTVEAVRKADIQTTAVEERAIDQEIVANGVISYDETRTAQLSARVPGTVWRIEKQLGQPVKKGDVLAIIEAMDIGKAKGELLQAVVDYQLKQGIADRLLTQQSSVPERQLEEVQAEARSAYIHLVNAQQTLLNLGLPIRIDTLEDVPDDELAGRIHFLGLPESIASTLDAETTSFSLVPLLSPLDGVVIGREISLGEIVSPSAEQFEVADISRMWILLDVRREDAGLLKLGQRVAFTVDGAGVEVTSTISWISSEINEKTRTVPVRAEVINPLVHDDQQPRQERRMLLAHSFGTGRVRVREVPAAALVPKDSVQWEGRRWVVFVKVDDTTFEARPVEVGISLRNQVEIRSGVVPGDAIATTGSHLLKSEIVRSRLASRQ
ncbi:MAG TPA: efflux RND transporter periplasmic adaptor subunit [Pirellulales bacterium]